MANGIDDLFQQEDQGGGITDIVIDAGKTEAAIKAKEVIDSIDQTGFLSSQLDPRDLKNLGQALADGDTESARDIFYNEVSQLQDVAPVAVLASLGITNNPLGNAIAAGNLANNAVQRFAMTADMISGIDIPGDNVFSTGVEGALNLINKPIQSGADIFGTGITGITGDYGNMMNNLIYNTPYYKFMANQAAKPFDLLYNIGLPSFFNRDKKPDPPAQLTNDQINQIVEDEINLGGGSVPPPIVVTDTQKDYESGVGQGTGQTGGPGGMGFAPPSPPPPPTVPNSGMTYRNVINRANGGLVSVSRYLKGR